MRFHLILSPATKAIPFNYQSSLVGVLHRWLGQNQYHNELSLYGFSHLLGSRKIQALPDQDRLSEHKKENGFFYWQGAQFFINAHDPSFFGPLVEGVKKNPSVFGGMVVQRIEIESEPELPIKNDAEHMSAIFVARSPIFLKFRRSEEETATYARYAFYNMPEADDLLTAVLHSKLKSAGLAIEGCRVSFERSLPVTRRVTAVTYRNMYLKASICPIRIEGTRQQVVFGWNVGAGHSTGIGFGALDFIKID